MFEQIKRLFLPCILFAAVIRLQIIIFDFKLFQGDLTPVVVLKAIGVSLFVVLALGLFIAVIFALIQGLLNLIPFCRGFRTPKGLLIAAILISVSLPLFSLMPAIFGVTTAADSRAAGFGLSMMAVSLATAVTWVLVLVMGIIKREKSTLNPLEQGSTSVMFSPFILVGFVLIPCIGLGVAVLSPATPSFIGLQSSDRVEGHADRMKAWEQQKLVDETMGKAGYMQDTNGNWNKVRPEPKTKYLQFVIDIDEPRLRAMGLDFIEVKNKINQDGKDIVKAHIESEIPDIKRLRNSLADLLLLRHPNGDVFLKDVAKVESRLSDQELPNNAPPFLIRLAPR